MNAEKKKENATSTSSRFTMANIFSGKKTLFGISAKIFASKEDENVNADLNDSIAGNSSRPNSAEAKNMESELKRRRVSAAEEAKRRITMAQTIHAPPPKPIHDPNSRSRKQSTMDQSPPPNRAQNDPKKKGEGEIPDTVNDASKSQSDAALNIAQPNVAGTPSTTPSGEEGEGITGVATPEVAAKLGLSTGVAALGSSTRDLPNSGTSSIRLAPLLYKGRPPRTAAERLAAVRAQTRNVESGSVPPSPDAVQIAIARRQMRHRQPAPPEEAEPSEGAEGDTPGTPPQMQAQDGAPSDD